MLSSAHRLLSLAVLALLPMLASCETNRTDIMHSNVSVVTSSTDLSSLLSVLERAQQALAAGEYQACTASFAAAARLSSGDEAATCWYRAARCAARAGDFTTSSFHLQAAVSSGYSNLSQLRSDTLLRPLRSGTRWRMVEDFIRVNQREQGLEQQHSLCQVVDDSRFAEQVAPAL